MQQALLPVFKRMEILSSSRPCRSIYWCLTPVNWYYDGHNLQIHKQHVRVRSAAQDFLRRQTVYCVRARKQRERSLLGEVHGNKHLLSCSTVMHSMLKTAECELLHNQRVGQATHAWKVSLMQVYTHSYFILYSFFFSLENGKKMLRSKFL